MKPTQRLSPVPRFIAVRVVPAVTILGSVILVGAGVQAGRLASESTGWPAVDGEIGGERTRVVRLPRGA